METTDAERELETALASIQAAETDTAREAAIRAAGQGEVRVGELVIQRALQRSGITELDAALQAVLALSRCTADRRPIRRFLQQARSYGVLRQSDGAFTGTWQMLLQLAVPGYASWDAGEGFRGDRLRAGVRILARFGIPDGLLLVITQYLIPRLQAPPSPAFLTQQKLRDEEGTVAQTGNSRALQLDLYLLMVHLAWHRFPIFDGLRITILARTLLAPVLALLGGYPRGVFATEHARD